MPNQEEVKEDLKESFIRDVCSTIPKPKLEVRRRLDEIIAQERQSAAYESN